MEEEVKADEILKVEKSSSMQKDYLAMSSIGCGVVAAISFLISWKIGVGLGLVGMILGLVALKAPKKKLALWGIIINALLFLIPIGILLYALISIKMIYP
ncbi:hypothetical protein [Thermoflavimicrobium daqui]|uniref:DUF4190 domain-containing protein n=1 Tax=Thermoflavimicrobium daqui TaxID=2137476 RepID=A0A364K5H6_9BACL|nr:hypothetical protein [Thermoflavimicrobium daqui]RAL25565.1 hypothetical protein DL897_05605 [Thermoflavimicrobium daqui]